MKLVTETGDELVLVEHKIQFFLTNKVDTEDNFDVVK